MSDPGVIDRSVVVEGRWGGGPVEIRRLGAPPFGRERFIQELIAQRVGQAGFLHMGARDIVRLAIELADELERQLAAGKP